MNLKDIQRVCAIATKANDAVAPILAFKSADQIADYLEQQGIQGIIGDSCNCALAKFVKKSGLRKVEVDSDGIDIKDAVSSKSEDYWGTNDNAQAVEVPATKAIAKFVENFDNGKYPNITKGGVKACKVAADE